MPFQSEFIWVWTIASIIIIIFVIIIISPAIHLSWSRFEIKLIGDPTYQVETKVVGNIDTVKRLTSGQTFICHSTYSILEEILS